MRAGIVLTGLLAALAVATQLAAAPRSASQDAPASAALPAPAATAARHLVLITLDTVRADKLGCYGYFRDTTPNLDRFAQQCVRFTRCLSPIANTTPSHASILTGVYPYEHGILDNFFLRPAVEQSALSLKTSPTLRTFAQSVDALGVRTGGFVAATPVKKSTGLHVGFATFTEPPSREPRRTAKEVLADALPFLDAAGDAPFFAWLHFFDAHGPVKPPKTPPKRYLELFKTDAQLSEWLAQRSFPDECEGEHAGAMATTDASNLYDGCLRFLDDQLAPLFARLDEEDRRADTVVVIVGDHGHGIGQHGQMSHGTAWDEQYHVPLLIRAPGLSPGTVESLVSTIDLLPTVIALLPGMRDPAFAAQCRGVDVLAADYVARPVIGQAARDNPIHTLTTTRWKLLQKPDGRLQLFDLEADPHEVHDVAAANDGIAQQLAKVLKRDLALQKQRHELHRRGAVSGGSGIDPQILEELRALGYTGDDSGEEPAQDGAPSDGGGRR